MIRVNEAILLLSTSAPTFYKWVKKEGIRLQSKTESTWKASYILENDLELLATRMWKKLITSEQSIEEWNNSSKKPTPNQSSEEAKILLKENYELQIQNKTLEWKVEEYSGYVTIYKEQTEAKEQKIMSLENERVGMYGELLKVKIHLSTYKVLFYVVILLIAISILLFSIGVISMS